MKTKLISLLLAVCLLVTALALVACGETPAETSGSSATASETKTTETSASSKTAQSSSESTTGSASASSSETESTGPVTPPVQILYGGGEVSEEMFELCLRSRTFDVGIFHNTGVHTSAISMAIAGRNSIVRSIASTVSSVNEGLRKWQDDIIEQYVK